MIAASPHLYRQQAAQLGISPQIVEYAIAQSAAPEKQKLPGILTLRHLAHLSGADYTYLRKITTRRHDAYRLFNVQKRSGGHRLIAAPEPHLAAIQRWIVDKILLERSASSSSFAYSRGSSPLRCAKLHLGAKWLIKIDIHDFFESISERRAYFVFRDCGYQPLVAFELARICTRVSSGDSANDERWHVNLKRQSNGLLDYRNEKMGHLPQGAPTSPLLSNLVSITLDEMIVKLATKYKLSYTRYSDDLTFSTGDSFTHVAAQDFLREVERILLTFGHAVHRKKTKISPPGARKIVLGLLVDGDHLKLPLNVRKRISDHVRGIEKFGISKHAASRHFISLWGMIRHIKGLLTYARSVDAKFAGPLEIRLTKALEQQSWPQKVISA
jgi:RNA-directed DNA polymerase